MLAPIKTTELPISEMAAKRQRKRLLFINFFDIPIIQEKKIIKELRYTEASPEFFIDVAKSKLCHRFLLVFWTLSLFTLRKNPIKSADIAI